uniref:hypothetical protein n=1 Tax=Flavobacterium sp. TaxID=239 RepID=UPI004049DB94
MDKDNNDMMEDFFNTHKDAWDLENLAEGHDSRFLEKLVDRKVKKPTFLYKIAGIAAVFVLGISMFLWWQNSEKTAVPKQLLSEQTLETENYFKVLIASEVEKLANHSNDVLVKRVVEDAMNELDRLELDYQNIKDELKRNGETKQLLHAMIINFQTRISFLENVLQQIESINNQKINQNENNIL